MKNPIYKIYEITKCFDFIKTLNLTEEEKKNLEIEAILINDAKQFIRDLKIQKILNK